MPLPRVRWTFAAPYMRSKKPDRTVEADETTSSRPASLLGSPRPAPKESEPSFPPPKRVVFWYPTPAKKSPERGPNPIGEAAVTPGWARPVSAPMAAGMGSL